MAAEKTFPVYGDNGLKGTLFAAARFLDTTPEKRVVLEDGREITVPSSSLEAQPDGSYYLRPPNGPTPPEAQETPVPQALSEAPAEGGTPKFITQSAAEQLFREDCDIQRIPVKRIVDSAVEIRYEGDTLIVPLMEEVLVVEKRLMLREELHITRRREPKASEAPIPKDELTPHSTTANS
jgi:hypothetical protein